MFLLANSFGQNKRTERKTIVENGVVKSWIIEKEFDHDGNLVNFDSSYTEEIMDPNDQGVHWDSGNGMQFNFNQGDVQSMQEMMDSLGFGGFNQMGYDFDELLKRYHNQTDDLYESEPLDSLRYEERFIFPDNKKSGKKI